MTGGFQVVPLNENRAPVAPFGAAQDRDPAEPDLRFYRLTATVPLTFGGQRQRTFQVQARGRCTWSEMVMLDKEYIANRCLGLDLRIMLVTIWVVLTLKGAR